MNYTVWGTFVCDAVASLLHIRVHNHAIFVLARALGIWAGVFLILLVTGVYMTLQHHHRVMSASTLHTFVAFVSAAPVFVISTNCYYMQGFHS